MEFVCRDKRVVYESDTPIFMVHTDVKFSTPSTPHDVRLDLLFLVSPFDAGFFEWCDEREVVNLDVVDLGQLGQETGEQSTLEEGKVG